MTLRWKCGTCGDVSEDPYAEHVCHAKIPFLNAPGLTVAPAKEQFNGGTVFDSYRAAEKRMLALDKASQALLDALDQGLPTGVAALNLRELL